MTLASKLYAVRYLEVWSEMAKPMQFHVRPLLALLIFVLLHGGTGVTTATELKVIAGWVEKAKLYPGGIEVKVKLDTGAKTSSLHCDCAEPFERDGERWIRFDVINYKGNRITFERRVHRVAKIKRHFGKVQERPVVMLGLCLGSIYKETEVTLVDRTGFEYQMLVGRKYMEGDFVVDPGVTYSTQPNCAVAPSE